MDNVASDSQFVLQGDIIPSSSRATPVVILAVLGVGEGDTDGDDNQSATRYRNIFQGTTVDDTLSGDVPLLSTPGKISLSVLVGNNADNGSGKGGSGNHLNAFHDVIFGNGGKDVLVGDVHFSEKGEIDLVTEVGCGNSVSVYDGYPGASGSHNTAESFNDLLFGGSGNDVLVGDVHRTTAIGSISLDAAAGIGADGGWHLWAAHGGANNTAESFNDHLTGFDGDNVLVGDFFGNIDSGIVNLTARAGNGGNGYTNGNGGDYNQVFAFSDTLSGFSGEDMLVGDVYRLYSHDSLEVVAAAGTGGTAGYGHVAGSTGGGGGDHNDTSAFNDTLWGRIGDDVLIGDVDHVSSSGDVLLAAGAGDGADQGGGSGGAGGDSNNVTAFNDDATGGSGGDLVVGDVSGHDDGGNITIRATAGNGGSGSFYHYRNGGAGGSDNHVVAFSDHLDGGDGADKVSGDLFIDGTSGSMSLEVSSGSGGVNGYGGNGGNDNSVAAFNDDVRGGSGDDILVGDVFLARSDDTSIQLNVKAGGDGDFSGGRGGANNAVTAFCDTLVGDAGADTIVGDLYSPEEVYADNIRVSFEVGADDAVRAFQDSIAGGTGNDVLFGDFLIGEAYQRPRLYGSVPHDHSDWQLQFSDTIDGGSGNDVIAGGLGADSMVGGTGADRFVWALDDLYDPPFPAEDTISDFSLEDVLDLRAFFSGISWSPGAEPDSSFVTLRQVGENTIVAFNYGNPDSSTDFVTLEGFTTNLTTQQLIDSGNLLIA